MLSILKVSLGSKTTDTRAANRERCHGERQQSYILPSARPELNFSLCVAFTQSTTDSAAFRNGVTAYAVIFQYHFN